MSEETKRVLLGGELAELVRRAKPPRLTEAEARAILAAELYVESMNDDDRPAWTALVQEAMHRLTPKEPR